MGQDELVLRIPADESGQKPQQSNDSGGGGLRSRDRDGDRAPLLQKNSKGNLTHSRESSGASVKFVNVTPNSDHGHRRTLSKGSALSSESHVIILQSPSGEDITLSDRLSNDEDEEDDLEQDLNCDEDDFHDRLQGGAEEYAKDELRWVYFFRLHTRKILTKFCNIKSVTPFFLLFLSFAHSFSTILH